RRSLWLSVQKHTHRFTRQPASAGNDHSLSGHIIDLVRSHGRRGAGETHERFQIITVAIDSADYHCLIRSRKLSKRGVFAIKHIAKFGIGGASFWRSNRKRALLVDERRARGSAQDRCERIGVVEEMCRG